MDVVPSAAVIYNDIDSLSYFAAIDNDLSEQLYNISSTCGGFGAFRSAVLTFILRKGYLVLMFLSFVRVFDFTGRGARMRGENPKRTGGKFARLTFPLSPLGFPLALPFPDSLTPLGHKSCILTHALRKILRAEAFFLLKGSCQVCGSAQIKQVLFSKQLMSNEWLTPQGGQGMRKGMSAAPA